MPPTPALAIDVPPSKRSDKASQGASKGKPSGALGSVKVKVPGLRRQGGVAVPVDPGALLNIAATADPEVARRAALRAGILTATGKLAPKYR
jgi:translation initiation factor 2 gamma subunit (eIF-2gamma)